MTADTPLFSRLEDAYPLAMMQIGMLFHGEYSAQEATYHDIFSYLLQAPFNSANLRKAVEQLTSRHPILRTSFDLVIFQTPVQLVHQQVEVPLQEDDLRHLSEAEQEIALQRWLEEEKLRPFDWTHAPLLRLWVHRVTEQTFLFTISFHHAILDGWSIATLLAEIFELYTALLEEREPALEPPPTEAFQQFIALEQEALASTQMQEYWRERLAEYSNTLLPRWSSARSSTLKASTEVRQYEVPVALEVSEQLKSLARRVMSPIKSVLLAAHLNVMRALMGHDDVLTGLISNGRPETNQGEQMPGMFLNTLPHRQQLMGGSWLELVQQTFEAEREAIPYRRYPLAQIQRDLGGEDLFETAFNFVHFHVWQRVQELQHLQVLEIRSFEQTNLTLAANFSLDLATSHIQLRLSYNTAALLEEQVQKIAGYYSVTLAAMAKEPTAHYEQCSLLAEQERTQLLEEWNVSVREYAPVHALHTFFENQALQTPHNVAVICGKQALTYRELDEQASWLAQKLQGLGVGMEVLVGVCMERTTEMLVALLGILKAGGAYVPLDPAYPAERLAFIFADSNISVLLTQQDLREHLPTHNVPVLYLDNLQDEEPINSREILSAQRDQYSTQERLAYVIYTSGSTGRPKGVGITHRSAVALIHWAQECFSPQALAGTLATTSICFDLSIFELFVPLSCGGTVILAKNALDLLDLPDGQVTLINTVPSVLSELISTKQLPTSVRVVNLAGEALQRSLVQWLYQQPHIEDVFNLYGPTEDTTYSTWARLQDQDRAVVPIGRPVSNSRSYLLDAHLQPVPQGVAGELYLGGIGLARGYLQRPELTAERFIPNPFSKEPGERLYRTGDLVRYLPNGEIEYLGRVDHQVKVRGFRIELGEIEAALLEYKAVRECVVVTREDIPGNKRLAAYLVAEKGQELNASQLREYLQESLPDYMIPAVFVMLEAMPLNPHGKVDRRALPQPDQERVDLAESYVAPRTAAEQTLAEIWAGVLRVKQVGIHDNFFALGGDSILSLQVIARSRQAGLYLTPKQIFQHKTIAQLASIADKNSAPQVSQSLVTGPVLLTPIQHWFFEQQQPEIHHWNQSMLLTVSSPLDNQLMRQVVAALLTHHDALRLRFALSPDGWQQYIVAPEDEINFTHVTLPATSHTEQEQYISRIASEIQRSLDLEKGPLLRMVYFALSGIEGGRLLIVVHHMAIDGVSWRILLEDLQTAYEQLASGKDVQLPPKTTSLQDWSQRLNVYAQSEELKREAAYWQAQKLQNIVHLPVDYASQDNTVTAARHVEVTLTEAETNALLYQVPLAYHTQINDVLLTALLLAVTQWVGGHSLFLNLEGHGREDILDRIDISRTVGWFTSMYPVMLDLGEHTGIGEVLKSVKEQLRQIPQRGIGYGLLRYLSQDQQVVETMPQLSAAQVSFNYLGQFDQSFAESGRFGPATESTGLPVSPLMQRPHLLDINGNITGNQLHVSWTYSVNIHRQETIEALAQSFVRALREIIAHCQLPDAGGYTPADFPLAHLKQAQIDTLIGHNRQVETVYPLSAMQKGLLYHALAEAAGGEYITQIRWTLSGDLRVPDWLQAWQSVVDRHTILRTALLWQQVSEPQQVVYRQVTLPCSQLDWRAYSVQEQQDRLKTYLQEDRDQGFDFSQAPLMRIVLIRTNETTYECIWTNHHILLDGWSLPQVFNEVLAYYTGGLQARNVQLPTVRPYEDYIAWLQQQDMVAAEAYWRQTLHSFNKPTPFGIDSPYPVSTEQLYGEYDIFLAPELLQSLQQLTRQHNLTLNTLFQGAWALLLSTYSGQQDVVFGTTLAGRPPEIDGIENMIGLFINTLPVRVQLKRTDSVLSWLHMLQQQQIDMRQYEYSPLVDVLRWSGVPRGVNLFESLLLFESYPVNEIELEDSSLSMKAANASAQTNYPLTIMVFPDQKFTIKVVYETHRFEKIAIQQMLQHLQTALEEMTTQISQPLSHISLLTVQERQMLQRWNLPPEKTGQTSAIQRLFEQRVDSMPMTFAACCEHITITYKELNQQANQLAHYLQTLGVQSGTAVGLCVPRSLKMLIGMLAVLKVGGVCVPIDSQFPGSYVEQILRIAQVDTLIVQQSTLDKLSDFHGCVVNPEQASEVIARQSTENLHNAVNGDHVAYKIFSAGKYVQITQHQIYQHLLYLQEQVHLSDRDVILQHSSVSVESAIWEQWWPLLFGGKVVIAAEGEQAVTEELLRIIDEQKVSVLHLTPTVLASLLTASQTRVGNTLRSILCSGGGPLSDEVAMLCAARAGVQSLYLHSTPETFTYLCTPISRSDDAEKSVSTIGTPARPVFILGVLQQIVPIGISGDLYVVVDEHCYGPLHESGASSETFIANALTTEAGTRLFKTGEQARYLRDGSIEILGIAGRALWHRGYYINLNELQKVLLGAPGVEDCVIRMHTPFTGNTELVAYVVTSGQFQPQRLQAHMSALLPAALLPQSYIPLSILPLTISGLIDEQALDSFSEATPEVAGRWEAFVRAQSRLGEHEVRALYQEYEEKTPVLHLSDLLPGWKDEREEADSGDVEEIASQTEIADQASPVYLALSDGGPLYIPEEAPKTFTQALLETATRYKHKGITYIQPDGTEDFQSYAALLHEARCILMGLQKEGLHAGDRAILQIETLREHFATFWACVLGGITPVTVAVAHSYNERNSVVNKLYNIWELLDHPPIIAKTRMTGMLKGLVTFLPMNDLHVLSVDELGANEPCMDIYPSRPEDLVFFQLTSGSTGIPKCIQETHRSVISHIHAARGFNGYAASNVSLNWLPVDHVVPILTCHLKDVYLGCSQIELRADMVLANPLKWLDYIEKYRVTHTWSPNFGYKLVSDWLSKGTENTWDLSSVQFFMNAGEQVTLPVVAEFLRLVEPFQMKPQAMQPSFGMAESCTCITFQNNFDVKTGVYRFEKSSLGGRLREARSDDTRAITFVDLGGPVPGVKIRITDKDNQTLPEGVIGRFQISGAVITPGYYKNEKANEEAFVGDGWFNSGDLGFILNGRLTLTGREKEIIIINGANHYCYEIEDVVNSIPGVEPTFVGTCGVADPRTGTEGLAIFFTPTVESIEERIALIKKIRATITTNVGLNPLYIVPIEKKNFAKTTSGKIQRTQMKKSLQAGEFDDLLKVIDIHLENNNTLPDWFYQKTWIKRDVSYQAVPSVGNGATLLLLDQLGLGEKVHAALQAAGQQVICVEMGGTFAHLSAGRYRINPAQREQYYTLLEMLQKDNIQIAQIVHLWTYSAYDGDLESVDQLETAQETGATSLLSLVQAAQHLYADVQALKLYVISSYTQAIYENDPLALEKLPLAGLLKTIGHEAPWIRCQQIDLPVEALDINASLILQELRATQGDVSVAYRNGTRLIQRLSRINWEQETTQESPVIVGGFYLLSGGLGGVGIEVARTLLKRYQAKLLLIGRKPLPPRNTWAELLADEDSSASLIAGYLELMQAGGEISYVAADICDQVAVQYAVEQAEARYGRPLDGVFHLAGTFTERVLQEETSEGLMQALRAKVAGTWVLHQLLKDRPGRLFVTFSSVNGFFGGAAVGAYAAANSFLDTFVHYQREQCGLQSYCFAWSMWDEIGISEGYHLKELTRLHGYYVISPKQAISSLLAGLRHTLPFLLIGLDGSNQYIRCYIDQSSHALRELVTYVVNAEEVQKASWYENLNCPDNYYLISVAELPVTATGEIDLQKLSIQGLHSRRSQARADLVPARNEMEQQFIDIWRSIFAIDRIGIHDNFFSLGGDSIVSIQVVARANQAGIRLTTKHLLQNPTIAELATVVNSTPTIKVEQGAVTGEVPLTPIQHWFFEQDLTEPHYWNMPLLLKVQRRLSVGVIKQALFHLLQHHDALRMRFVQKESVWQQSNAPLTEDLPLLVIDLSAVGKASHTRLIEEVAVQAQAALNLAEGPLVRMIYFDPGKELQPRLFLLIHHLVMDGVSWRILIEDLQQISEQLNRGQAVQLPTKTASFKQWSEQLQAYAQTDMVRQEVDYWLTHAGYTSTALPRDYTDGKNSVASMRAITLALSSEETEALLHKVPEAYHTQINDVLLTALAQTMKAWTGQTTVRVNLEGHGREEVLEDIDISRTVGWFTSLYPVLLDLMGAESAGEDLKAIKEQQRKIPHKGIGYGILRYLTNLPADAAEATKLARLRQLAEAEVSFNYLGQFDQTLSEDALFSMAPESTGSERSPEGARKHLLDIVGNINGGKLWMSWMYSEQVHTSETIMRQAEQYMQTLRSLIEHCQSKAADEFTPSDFPLAALEQEELDMIVKKLNRKRGR